MCYVMFKSFFIVYIIVLINIKIIECKINKNTDLVDLTGVNFYTENNEVKIKLDVEKLLSEELKSRHDHDDDNNAVNNNNEQPNIFQRIGAMLMMIPLMMQVLSLPGALASIKMSLLKSLFVGKLALIIMLYNLLISLRSNSETVFVNHGPSRPEHYDHYYSPYDDDDSGPFG